MKKGIALLALAGVLIASLLIAGCAPAPKPAPSPAPAPAPTVAPPPAVELKIWSAWATDKWTTKPYMHWFLAKVAEKSKAVNLTFKYVGGPEVFPTEQGMDSLKKGVIDAAFTTTAYHVGMVPEADTMKLSRLEPWEERASGAYDLMNKVHQEKANAWYSWRLPHNGYFTIYLNVERTKPDLSGLKVRTTPIYTALIKALGGTPVSMAIDEIYTALERKMVDGYGYPVPGLSDRKLETVTKYQWGPPFYASPTGVWYNLDKWKSLDERQRAFLTEMAIAAEKDAYPMWQEDLKKDWEVNSKAGVQKIKFSPEDEKYFLDLAYDIGWKDVIGKAPDAAKFRPLMEKK